MGIASNESSRRDFLKGTAWMLGAAAAAGCSFDKINFSNGGSMANFAVPPMEKIRVGFIGIGERGLRRCGESISFLGLRLRLFVM